MVNHGIAGLGDEYASYCFDEGFAKIFYLVKNYALILLLAYKDYYIVVGLENSYFCLSDLFIRQS